MALTVTVHVQAFKRHIRRLKSDDFVKLKRNLAMIHIKLQAAKEEKSLKLDFNIVHMSMLF